MSRDNDLLVLISRNVLLAFMAAPWVAGCNADQATAPAGRVPVVAAAQAAAHRPVSGRFAGSSAFIATCAEPGSMLIQVQGTGVATHLGRGTVEMTGCVVMTPTGFAAASPGVGHLIAANGDTLRFTAPTAEMDMITGTARIGYVLSGGSGRFQSATGELTALGHLLPGGDWTNEITGWIAY